MADINPNDVQWDEPEIDPAAVEWDEPSAKGPSVRNRGKSPELPYVQRLQLGMQRLVNEARAVPGQLPRAAGIGLRGLAQGAADTLTLPADAAADLFNRVTGKTPALALTVPKSSTLSGGTEAALDATGLPQPQNTAERLLNVGTGVMGGAVAGRALNPLTQTLTPKAPDNVAPVLNEKQQVFQQGRDAGYVAPPSSVNPTARNVLIEGIGGKAATQQVASIKNQTVTNNLVARELGLPESGTISKDALLRIRSDAGRVYQEVAKAGDEVAADAQYLDELAQIGRGVDEIRNATTGFPDANVGNTDQIQKLVNSLLRDKFSTKAALEYMKQLRAEASGNLSSLAAADPAKRSLGLAQRDAAAALEDMVMRNLTAKGQGDLAQRFNEARQLIAKTHTVERALNESTGNVAARNLAGQLKKGVPLSGPMRQAAAFAQSFPKASEEVLHSPGVSALDALVGGGGAFVNPALAAWPVARIGARYGMLTDTVQNSLLPTRLRGPVDPAVLFGGAGGLLAGQ